MLSNHGTMATIEHFKRLSPDVRLALAERFGLTRTDDRDPSAMTNQWLLRAKELGRLEDLATAVQVAPQ